MTIYFSFGSDQLQDFNLPTRSADNILVEVEADTEEDARKLVFNSFIGKKFCTSYTKYSDWMKDHQILSLKELTQYFKFSNSKKYSIS